MIAEARWNQIQDAVANMVGAQGFGLTPKRAKTKYKRRVFRLFDAEIALVDDGQTKIDMALCLNLESGSAHFEATLRKNLGYSLAYEELRAAYHKNTSELVENLYFEDPSEESDRTRTQQRISLTIDGVDFQTDDVSAIAGQITAKFRRFYEIIKRLNDLAKRGQSPQC